MSSAPHFWCGDAEPEAISGSTGRRRPNIDPDPGDAATRDAGDGSCLYRTSLALYGTEQHHLLVRFLAALEIVEHRFDYDIDDPNYSSLSGLQKHDSLYPDPYFTLIGAVCKPWWEGD